jgi:6-phosphofructokinase 1
MEKFAVLTSGGDAPGMNACIRAVVRSAARYKVRVEGIRDGYKGLLENDFVKLSPRSVANILQRGGTFLGTSRCDEMKTSAGIEKAIQVLRQRNISGLILIGGDGTFRGGTVLAQGRDVKIVGIPGSIDNDIYGTDYSIGFDTALNTALDAIDKIRDTAGASGRTFFIEVMGRKRGFIALDVGIAAGAENILIPEVETRIDELASDIHNSLKRGKKSHIVVVAEGDDAGGVFPIAQQVWERLRLNYRVCVLGHVQRGGTPTARDRILAGKLGSAAVDALVAGETGYMVGEINGVIRLTPLRETWEMQKELDSNLLKLMKVLAV